MKIVIVGAGNVGCTLARNLSSEKHDVVVVESDDGSAAKLAEEQDVIVVRGNGARPDVLAQAGVEKNGSVDVLIACTDKDETNLMACWLAKRAGVPRVLSRVRDQEFSDTPDWAQDLGIDLLVSPERSLSREIASLLRFNAAVYASELSNRRAGSFAFLVEKDSPICGLSLREVGSKYPNLNSIVIYVERGDDGFVPSGDWVAREGDLCFVVTLRERAARVQKLFDTESHKRLSRVIIVGGGKLGINLAKRLSPNVDTTIVEKDLEKCEKLAQIFPDVRVIHGDGLDLDLMTQLGVDKADGVVAATADDELNVVIAALANLNDDVKTIAVVRNDVYDELEGRMPVDVFVNPNRTLANTFLRYIRYPSSAGMLSLIDRIGAEMLEFLLRPGNPAAGKRIMDLSLPGGILIAMIKRGGRYLVPGGADVLEEGDVISVFAMADMMPEAMHLFGVDKS